MKNNTDIKEEISQISTILNEVKVNINYSSPTGYFDALPAIIKEKINQESNINIFNLETSGNLKQLSSCNKMYAAPKSYFSSLPKIILDKVGDKKNIKDITSKKRFYQYSAAAIFIAILGTILFFNLPHKNKLGDSISNTPVFKEAKYIISHQTLEEELDNLNDKDAVDYLTENGHDLNAALVASLNENVSLPDEIDYLNDNETLNNYLNKIKQ
jgi:hypothetical protein